MPEIVVRQMRAEEVERVSAQIAESYKATYKGMMRQAYLDSLDRRHWVPILESSLARGDVCLLAISGGVVVGSLVYVPPGRPAGNLFLLAIYVAPGFSGQGAGSRLIRQMEKDARGMGCSSCSLEVLVQNRQAIQFYQKHGYATTDTFTVQENGMQLECHKMLKSFA